MAYSCAPPFTHWSGAKRPKIVFVGEAWGESEDEIKRPFVGASGREFFLMLGEALGMSETWREARQAFRFGHGWVGKRDDWLRSEGFAFTNVLALRPPDNKIDALCVSKKELPHGYPHPQIDQGRYLDPLYLPELTRLGLELSEARPNLVVALGNVACWALLGTRGISSLRGTVGLSAEGRKVLPTYHPAGVMRNWSWRPIVVGDLMKAGREAAFPEIRRPSRQIIISPTLEEVESWTTKAIADASPLAVDTETSRGQITMVGFARSASDALVIPFRNFLGGTAPLHYWSEWEETRAWDCVRKVLAAPCPKKYQNGLYDIQYFMSMGLRPQWSVEDTMLKHHSILPEMQKGLGFLGSVYTSEPAWKLMRKKRADEPEKADE